MSGFVVLGGIMNIAQLIRAILRHVDGYHQLHIILKDAALKTKQIEAKVRKLQHLYTLDGLQSEIILGAVEEFEEIRDDLIALQEKVTNRSTARTFLSSPGAVEEVKQINMQLAKKDDMLKVVAMVGALNVEHRKNCALILTELKSKSPEASSVDNMVELISQMKMVDDNVRGIVQRKVGYAAEHMTGYSHLATGAGMYEGKFGVKNYALAARELNAAVKAGCHEAYYYLGLLYKEGLGVEQCSVTAKNFFLEGTNAGDAAAMAQLGYCYDIGLGVEMCPIEALKLAKNAAETGDPYGMAVYGWYKLYGQNTDVNFPLGYKMVSRAANEGFGKEVLATCYELGIGVDRDTARAVKIYTEATEERDNLTDLLRLAYLYEQGIGVDVDFRTAARLYKRGTEYSPLIQPFFNAYYGMCLIMGKGVCEDKKKGWDQIEKSIQAHNATGWHASGECYRLGYGVESDLKKAAKCYKLATESENGMIGVVRAAFELGRMLEAGEGGLPQDLAGAFENYHFAANRMHQEAQWKVANACETGRGVNHSEDRAVYYFQLAANSGHRGAQVKFSEYYMKGKGLPRDLHKAAQILRLAAENGNRDAERLLHRIERKIVLRRMLPKRTRSAPAELAWFSRGCLKKSSRHSQT